MTFTILDLFCGAGGFSLGFKRAFPEGEFYGIDNWNKACQAYERNVGIAKNIDLLNVNLKDLPDADIILGSPPCQQFSAANPNRTHDMTLVEKFLEVVEELQPTTWIMENVPGVSRDLVKLYSGYTQIIKAQDHGKPHLRRRLFAGPIPKVEPSNPVEKIFPTPLATEWNAPNRSHSLSAMFNGKRPPLRVVKWLMGFPRGYFLPGNLRDQYTLIGNAVVVDVAEAIARQLLEDGL